MAPGLLEIKTSPSWNEMFDGELPVDWTYQVPFPEMFCWLDWE